MANLATKYNIIVFIPFSLPPALNCPDNTISGSNKKIAIFLSGCEAISCNKISSFSCYMTINGVYKWDAMPCCHS